MIPGSFVRQWTGISGHSYRECSNDEGNLVNAQWRQADLGKDTGRCRIAAGYKGKVIAVKNGEPKSLTAFGHHPLALLIESI